MKNIHILPSKKQSRLVFLEKLILLDKGWESFATQENNRHVYITSFNEEIKEGDWCIDEDGLMKCTAHSGVMNHYFSKIILTTDQDLIKDGVQAIDDEFLEWFVKNPSCEKIEVIFNNRGITGAEKILKTFGEYEIVIPKKRAIEELSDNFLLHVNKIKSENLEIDGYIKLGFINGAERQSQIILAEVIQDLEKPICSVLNLNC